MTEESVDTFRARAAAWLTQNRQHAPRDLPGHAGAQAEHRLQRAIDQQAAKQGQDDAEAGHLSPPPD